MTLPVPRLDGRSYDDLLNEALRRLPLYTPEYTNHNASDPGRAILEANAFLAETILYQINRVPDQTYIAFLNLLGIAPHPARPARAELAVTLKDLKRPGDPLLVDVPRGSQIAVDDPDLDEDVVFETDRSLRALNATVGLALVPQGSSGEVWQAVTRFDSDDTRETEWLHAFNPFGETEAAGRSLLFALVLRPKANQVMPEDRLPSGPVDLFVEATQVFDPDAQGTVIPGPLSDRAGPFARPPDAMPSVTWEVFTGGESGLFTLHGKTGWSTLNLSLDETDDLRRSGLVTLELPATATPVRLGAAPPAAWEAMDRRRAPMTGTELTDLLATGSADAEALKAALTPELLAEMGVEGDAAGLLSACADAPELAERLRALGDSLDPSVIAQELWGTVLPIYAAPDVPMVEDPDTGAPVYMPLYFFRATLTTADEVPRLLNRLRFNVVRATAASTRKDERLGVSNGRPGQSLRLSRAPVAIDGLTGLPELQLTVTLNGVTETWRRVADFHGSGPADTVFLLDPATGEIRFGDGRPEGIGGAIPQTGAVIRAAHYRFGGGRVANVAPDTITKIKGALTHVKSVTNPRAAAGGADGETLDQVRRRAPSTLRRRERAVSAADFADLARETPGAAIHMAYAIAAHAPGPTGLVARPGAVTVVVLPDIDHPTPQPDAATLSAVRKWLDPRRLVTTELHVTGPRYFRITELSARLTLVADADFATVTQAASKALARWFDPIRGGAEGSGWLIGFDIYHAEIYEVLLAVRGVRRVSRLRLQHDPVPAGSPADVVPVPEDALPALMPGAIGLEVGYA